MHCNWFVITSITWCITCITCSITSSTITLYIRLHDKHMLDYMPLRPAPFHYMLNYMHYYIYHYMPLYPAPLHYMLNCMLNYMLNYMLHYILNYIPLHALHGIKLPEPMITCFLHRLPQPRSPPP